MKCSKCKNDALPNAVLCTDCCRKKTDRRREKRAIGECAYCSKPVVDGASLCFEHRERKRHKMTSLLNERKINSLCVLCGKSSSDNTCAKCKNKRHKRFSLRNEKNLCRQCPNEKLSNSTYCLACKQYQYEYTRKLRQQVLDYYGNACACCGETIYEFLAIDHVNNDGNIDRANGIRGPGLVRKIIAENYPDKYQILCHNCNFAKQFSPDGCPHQRIKKENVK